MNIKTLLLIILFLLASGCTQKKSKYNRACEAGDTKSCLTLGNIEFKAGNLQAARTIYEKLCSARNTDGCFNLGLLEKQANNLDLSKKRAEAVVNELSAKYGVAVTRLVPQGVGPTCPLTSNKTEDGKAQNRRVELVEQ